MQTTTRHPVTIDTLTVGSTIAPRDFRSRTTERDQDMWRAGELAHVVAVLAQQPVMVTTDRSIGYNTVGVLEAVSPSRSNGYDLTVRDSTGQATRYHTSKIGPIVPLHDGIQSSKYIALRRVRDAEAEAVTAALKDYGQHNRYDAECLVPGSVDVTVTHFGENTSRTSYHRYSDWTATAV